MLTDILHREDIKNVVNTFYDAVKDDPILRAHFEHVQWESHLPVMYDFWENVIFYTGNFSGNPMAKHQSLHHHMPISPDHFKKWLQLFTNTIDTLYSGTNADLLKERAKSIAIIMQMKILNEKGI
ncbi:MAG: group III truncated hemoglobin [Saprospiraceae bacterium]|nr:group III truncated hemoglobin [Saprospiraceae bacterium]